MENNKRVGKLSILDPWELGTDKPIDTLIIDSDQTQYLFFLKKPLSIKDKSIRYLIGELRQEKSIDLFSDKTKGKFALNMVYSEAINEQNFRVNRIKDFRSNFLLGEVLLS